jgi:hypothetical protein
MGTVTSITKEAFVDVSKDEDGTYRLFANGRQEEHSSVQSIWAALDEIDAPRTDAVADAA